MIRELRNDKITREDIYAKYFDLCDENTVGITEEFSKKINRAREIFGGKKQINIVIRGSIFGVGKEISHFTFVDEVYPIDRDGLQATLEVLDGFGKFIFDKTDISNDLFFSNPEQSYVSKKVIANAEVSIYVE